MMILFVGFLSQKWKVILSTQGGAECRQEADGWWQSTWENSRRDRKMMFTEPQKNDASGVSTNEHHRHWPEKLPQPSSVLASSAGCGVFAGRGALNPAWGADGLPLATPLTVLSGASSSTSSNGSQWLTATLTPPFSVTLTSLCFLLTLLLEKFSDAL